MSIGRVEFRSVWKKFRVGPVNDRLRDVLPALAKRALGLRPGAAALAAGEFWALKELDFALGPGDSLGILGANGAGKSTALKLLTGILRPTRGSCRTVGRVGALIDVAAGFHPDLSGRENVYLQGAIMGMPQREIARKFDEIVAFSGVEYFIDTPVKRYSSGMHARLGFAIAAHLDPDVLVVDEAIAVGDAAFQRKAFDRVRTLVQREIPVVLVSHQLDMISALCNQAIWLERGAVAHRGSPAECIAEYLAGTRASSAASAGQRATTITEVACEPKLAISGGKTRVALRCEIAGRPSAETVGLRIRSAQSGEVVFETSAHQQGCALPEAGSFAVEIDLTLNVPRGLYVAEAFVWSYSAGREIGAGPSARLEVHAGPEFDGSVQMSPAFRLRELTA